MHIYDGPTGRAIREERNHERNAGKPYRRLNPFKLHGCPNPLARRTAIFRAKKNLL